MRFILFFQMFLCSSHLWGIVLCLNVIHDSKYSLECLNDYLYTISCELNGTSEPQSHDALYWLEFYDEREPFECVLTSHTYPWVCVLNLSTRVEDTFTDTNFFQISLNYSFHGNNKSAVLEKAYRPVHHIRPVPPSNLTLLWKPDELVFSWSSGYDHIGFLKLKYQLSIHGNEKVLDVHSISTNISVPMSNLNPNTNYTAHVRSAPQQTHYKGVWSHWGPTINWTTLPKKSTGPEAETLDKSFATFCSALFVLPAILLFYFSYTRWKRCKLDPSPVPHVGEFKRSALLPEKVGELLKKEKSLLIDSLNEDFDSAPEPNPTRYENTSNGVNDGSGHTSFSDSPESPSMLQSDVSSKGTSSTWVRVLMSAEKASLTYSDDYCTLSHALSEHTVNTREC